MKGCQANIVVAISLSLFILLSIIVFLQKVFLFVLNVCMWTFSNTVAFNDKCRDYLTACQQEGIAFIPFPVETLGGWPRLSSISRSWPRARSGAMARMRMWILAVNQLFQRFLVLLVKGNAALILNRIPNHPTSDIDGVL